MLPLQRVKQSSCRRNEAPASFETALSELEHIVTRTESGDLPLEDALNEFERGVQLARQGQAKLQQAEQRVQILLSDNEEASPEPLSRIMSKWTLRSSYRLA